MHRFLATASLLLCCFLAFAASESGEIIAPGHSLPPFCVTTDDGKRISNDSLLGKTSLIVFFNTSCRDCRRELPLLQRLQREWGDGVRILCISRAETAESVRRFWQQEALTLPFSAQSDREVYHRFARRGIPKLYVADRNGKVVCAFSEKASRRKLQRAVRAASRP